MPTLGLKQAAWEASTPDQQRVLKLIDAELALGDPAIGTIGAVTWRLYDDGRFAPAKIAYFGCLCANQAEIFATWVPPQDLGQMRTELKAILEDPGLTHPLVKWGDMNPPEDTENIWQYILDQEATPNFCQMWSGVPDGFVPEEGGP